MTEAPTKPTWTEFRDLLRLFVSFFGEPRELWEDQYIRRKDAVVMRAWLCALEAVARALLTIIAVELPNPTPAQPRKAGVRKRVDPATHEITSGNETPGSERWADVAFVLAPPTRPALLLKRRRRRARRLVVPTRRLAIRMEALIRVAENPERYARRIARRLHARPKLIWRILRWPKPPGCDSIPRDDIGRAQAHAWFAFERFAPNTG